MSTGSKAVTVANAIGAVITRTLVGVAIGVVVGVAVFVVEKSAGWLDGAGWQEMLAWLLLPVYIVAASAAVGYYGFWSGVRQAARTILLDSGWLRAAVERALARARKAAEAPARADRDDANPDEPPARGWIGSRISAIGTSMARTIVARLGSAAAPGAETGAQVDRIAGELIDDVGLVPSIIALVVLAATVAVAPLLLA